MLNATTFRAQQVLAKLKQQLENAEQSQLQSHILAPWIKQIDTVIAKSGNTRVIIGIVGATGSGKSSIINALLGEKQVIPTNCMRACTAVVTEISYNDQPGLPWRAVIEFISPEAWRKELDILLGDVNTAAGSIHDEDSEAGIAFSKITAVYPSISKKNISEAEVETLMQKEEVSNYLGTALQFSEATSEQLHNEIQRYIDSKEKVGILYADMGWSSSREMDNIEYWPLISRVCIYGRVPVLRTGCVLVDLPGVADSNSARAAVAKSYLKNCAALWVMAPIIRAVDDRTARHLLGEGFKRQLHRDGTLSRISFVCSKSDEIVIREARHELDHIQDFVDGVAHIDLAKTDFAKDLNAANLALAQAKRDLQDAMERHARIYKEEQAYRQLRNLATSTKSPVHPPLLTDLAKKRRNDRDNTMESPTKRTRFDNYLSRASQSSPRSDEASASASVKSVPSTVPATPQPVVQDLSKPGMTAAAIMTKIVELSQARSAARSEKDEAKGRKEKYTNELEELKKLEEEILAREWSACVLGRNKYTTSSIQADFAAGLQDLARDDAQEDDDNFDPSEEPETDAYVASSLPVFCVSSQGYQKLQGHLEGEQVASRFSNLADTGVPALQQHARKIGADQMLADEEAFMNDARRLLTSLRLWSTCTEEAAASYFKDADTEDAVSVIDEFVQVGTSGLHLGT